MFKTMFKSLWKICGKVFNNLKNMFQYMRVFHIVDKFSRMFSTNIFSVFNLFLGGFCTFST